MTHDIHIQNEEGYVVDESRLQAASVHVLKSHDSEGELTIVITTNEAVTELNRQYREIDAPTDVLSFPAGDEMLDGSQYWGDLIIAYPYALEQAQMLGHDIADSLVLLVIHGTLHLLGYDHYTPENRAAMWAKQDEMLKQLHVPTSIVPTLEGNKHE